MLENDLQRVNLQVAEMQMDPISVRRDLEQYYRRATDLKTSALNINTIFLELKRKMVGQGEAVLLRKTLLELGFRYELAKEECLYLNENIEQMNEDLSLYLSESKERLKAYMPQVE